MFRVGLVFFWMLGQAEAFSADANQRLGEYNVSWDSPGPTSAESMPLGNGDIGLNVWAETNGDVLFYISKSDAWNQDVYGNAGLMKLGGVRISLKPFSFIEGTPFLQELKLHEGAIEIKEGPGDREALFRIWVDANHPVIRVEAKSANLPASLEVSLVDWRLECENRDVVVPGQTNRIVWYHRNSSAANSNVANLTFGAVIQGEGLVNSSLTNLSSTALGESHVVSIYPMTARTATPAQWQALLDGQVHQAESLNLSDTWQAHCQWWDGFWNRSWIFVTGDADATNVTRGYILQRFVTACAGRGAYPIKFNGSLFVVDNPETKYTADDRDWGGAILVSKHARDVLAKAGSGRFRYDAPAF